MEEEGVNNGVNNGGGGGDIIMQLYQPSPDTLTAGHLVRTIRAEIGFLYGDYGVGMTASRLTGTIPPLLSPLSLYPYPFLSALLRRQEGKY